MYRVDEATCTGCGDCVETCPAGAISLVDGRARIAGATCADCGSCADACPQGAIVMADAASPACAAIGPGTSISAIVPAVASVEAGSLAHQPEVEVLPAEPSHSRLWPMVGSALVWAARKLVPELIAGWRASRAGIAQTNSYGPDAFRLAARRDRRTGHRHRWGRA